MAYAAQPYSFQFSPETFTTAQSSWLSYSITSDLPNWLSLDNSTRTFYGTPDNSDIGSMTLTLTASDLDGVADTQVTIVVVPTNAISPTASNNGNINGPLSRSGGLAAENTLALRTGFNFDVGLGTDVFQGGENLSYYATLEDRSPLPSWLKFDVTNLAFSGMTPASVGSGGPQSYRIRLMASSVEGFEEAEVHFNLVVNEHVLAFQQFTQAVNISSRQGIKYTTLKSQLLLDGAAVSDAQIKSATAQTPSWLRLDPETLIIAGQPPIGLSTQSVYVNITDIYGDSAECIVVFQLASELFDGEIGTINATIGKEFRYQISQTMFAQSNENLSINFGNASSWLQFNAQTLTISGMVPKTASPSAIQLTLIATSGSGTITESQPFEIRLLQLGHSSSSASPTSGRSSMTNIAAGGVPTSRLNTTDKIIIAVVVSVVAVGFALGLLLCLWRKRRRAQQTCKLKEEKPQQKTTHTSEPTADSLNKIDRDEQNGFFSRSYSKYDQTGMPENAAAENGLPSIGGNDRVLHISNEHGNVAKYRISKHSDLELEADDVAVLGSQNKTLWDGFATSHIPHDSMRPATIIARGGTISSQNERSSTKPRHDRLSRISKRSSGLPIERRMTGFGHGRTNYGSPSRDHSARNSRQRNSSVFSSSPSASMIPDRFAEPPNGEPPKMKRLRPLPGFSKHDGARVLVQDEETDELAINDGERAFEDKRASYIRRRASSGQQRPLFSAAMGRSTESSHSAPAKSAKISHSATRPPRRMFKTLSQTSSLGIQMHPHVVEDLSTQTSLVSDNNWTDVSSSHYTDDGEAAAANQSAVINHIDRKMNEQTTASSDDARNPREARQSHNSPRARRAPLSSILNQSQQSLNRSRTSVGRHSSKAGSERATGDRSFHGHTAFV